MNERIDSILRNPNTKLIGVGVSAFAAGLGLGYVLWHQTVEVIKPAEAIGKIDQIVETEEGLEIDIELNEQGEELVESFVIPYQYGENNPADIVVDEAGKRLMEQLIEEHGRKEGYKKWSEITFPPPEEAVVEEVVEEPEVVVNVFAGNSEAWDYEEELKARSSAAPYVLHKDEFYADELDYGQSTLTYFKGDDILVDEDDKPIYNYSQVIGELRFGHGSNDPNVFYVRNDKNKAEYEVILDTGQYAVEILGLDDSGEELQHSVGKFRWDD